MNPDPKDSRLLFAYGTLRLGVKNRFTCLLQNSSELLGHGFTNGRLYQITDYPGLVLSDQPSEKVRGDVYRLDRPNEIWPILDKYESCAPDDPHPHEFQPELINVLIDNGQQVRATAYIYHGDVSASAWIETGDFLRLGASASHRFSAHSK